MLASIEAKIVKGLIIGAGQLPLPLARGVGKLLGRLIYGINGRGVQTTRTNIALCFPELSGAEQEVLVKQSVVETAVLAFEVCVVGCRSFDWLNTHTKVVEGEELAHAAMEKKQGMLILAPHLGNWEVLGPLLANYGQTVNLYQKPKKAYLENLIVQFREKSKVTLVPTNRKGISQIFSNLKSGGISGVLPDQVPEKSGGIFAPFYGHDAMTMTFVYKLIQKTGCTAVFAFAERVDNGFELHFLSAPDAIYDKDMQTSVNALNTGVENCVNLAKAQYQWEYKRFRERKEGEPDPYWTKYPKNR